MSRKPNLKTLTLTCVIALFGLSSFAGEIVIRETVEFDVGNLQVTTVDGNTRLELPDAHAWAKAPGDPALPTKTVRIVLPPNGHVVKVSSKVKGTKKLVGSYRVTPMARPVALSAGSAGETIVEAGHSASELSPEMVARLSYEDAPQKAVANAKVYASVVPLRSDPVELLAEDSQGGVRFAALRLSPVDYTPATGEVVTRAKIEIECVVQTNYAAAEITKAASSITEPDLSVLSDALNIADADSFYPTASMATESLTAAPMAMSYTGSSPQEVKYLVIGDFAGSNSTLSALQPLIDWKIKKGVPAEAVDVDWIAANYSGGSLQEKIRACIYYYWHTQGTVWVLLAGDDTIIPEKDCYVSCGGETENYMPTDLYYSAMNDGPSDWDDDNDGRAGEYDDNVDLTPRLHLGRFPGRTAAQLEAMVDKTLDYEESCPATGFAETMLLGGTKLETTGDAEDFAEAMYATWQDKGWTHDRDYFYDSDTSFTGGASYEVNASHLTDLLETGYGSFHMVSRGGYGHWRMEDWWYNGKFNTSDASALYHPGLATHIVSVASDTGWFDDLPLGLGEVLMRNPDGGAVTFAGFSRLAWIYDDYSHGATMFTGLYWKRLQNDYEGDPGATFGKRPGYTFTRTKVIYAPYANYSYYNYPSARWNMMSLNFFGDPELPVYTDNPTTMSPTFSSTISGASSQSFTVEANQSYGSSSYSGPHVCLMKDGELYSYGSSNWDGTYTVNLPPMSPGTMHVTITSPNCYPYEGTVTVTN